MGSSGALLSLRALPIGQRLVGCVSWICFSDMRTATSPRPSPLEPCMEGQSLGQSLLHEVAQTCYCPVIARSVIANLLSCHAVAKLADLERRCLTAYAMLHGSRFWDLPCTCASEAVTQDQERGEGESRCRGADARPIASEMDVDLHRLRTSFSRQGCAGDEIPTLAGGVKLQSLKPSASQVGLRFVRNEHVGNPRTETSKPAARP